MKQQLLDFIRYILQNSQRLFRESAKTLVGGIVGGIVVSWQLGGMPTLEFTISFTIVLFIVVLSFGFAEWWWSSPSPPRRAS